MPPPGSCKVCEHPDRVAIEAALVSGTPGLRATGRQYKFKDHKVLTTHRREHMGVVAPKMEEVARAKIAAVAPVQLERATAALVRTRAEQAVEEAVAVQVVARQLAERAMGTEENPGDIEIAAKALKVWIDSNGGGVQRALELLGKINGELATGSQVNVQIINSAVHEAVYLSAQETVRYLAERDEAAVRAGLAELGVTGPALERGTAAVVRHLVAGRAGLGARIAAVLDEGGAPV